MNTRQCYVTRTLPVLLYTGTMSLVWLEVSKENPLSSSQAEWMGFGHSEDCSEKNMERLESSLNQLDQQRVKLWENSPFQGHCLFLAGRKALGCDDGFNP